MTTLLSPKDGDVVANCGHDDLRHMFRFPEPVPTQCSDPECHQMAEWYSCCGSCFDHGRRTGDFRLREHATWVGDEPLSYEVQS